MICSLCDRLVSHAQYRKAETVQLLTNALSSQSSHEDTANSGHRILLLLYQISNSPLNAIFEPLEATQQLLLELQGENSLLQILAGVLGISLRELLGFLGQKSCH